MNWIESLLSHKINNHISYVTTLKEGIYINYRENQDKNYKTRLCLKTKRLTNVFLNLSVFILGWWLVSFLRLYLVRCMTSVTHKFKDESTSKLPRDGFFFSSLHIYKNLPRITVFRKLKCPDPSMIPLPAEVKECSQKSIRLTSYILI